MRKSIFRRLICLVLAVLAGVRCDAAEPKSPADNLPPHIRRLTTFGERADFSHDGKKILFLAKTYGDVFEYELATGQLTCLTNHYYHGGYTRALYLANGDVLLSGCTSFDAAQPNLNREAKAELWVLGQAHNKPPVSLGTKCYEGPAVSRKHLRIAYTIDGVQYPEMGEYHYQIWMADIVYTDRVPALANRTLILDNQKVGFKVRPEPQNFRPPHERELTFSAYDHGTRDNNSSQVMGLDLATHALVDYTQRPDLYQEPEGIFPDGNWTLMESDEQNLGGWKNVDIWRLKLDDSHTRERLTYFTDYPTYKSSNPVVSDDGRTMAFQMGRSGDGAGVGYGIFLYDFNLAAKVAK